MHAPLRPLFEEQLRFRTPKGDIEDEVYIGESELDVAEVLRQSGYYDAEFENWYRDHWKPRQRETLEEILDFPRNRDRYIDVKLAVGRGQSVPFVGSGMSVASGLSTWSDLLRSLLDGDEAEQKLLEERLSVSDFEGAADFITQTVSRQWFDEQVEHLLRINRAEEVQGPIRLLPGIFRSCILTSNLDNVLELWTKHAQDAFDSVLLGPDIAQYRRAKEPNHRYLLKLHGDHRQPHGRVLTSAEYESAYGAKGAVREEFELLVRNNHLLFLGCSLGPDRTVRCLVELIDQGKTMARHHAFLKHPDDEHLRREREKFLTSRGIHPIWYSGPHDEALTALLAGLLPDWEV